MDVEFRPLPGYPHHRIGSDRSVWAQRKSGCTWRRLSVAPGRVDELMRIVFPSNETPRGLPPGVSFVVVPGFDDYGIGSDRSVWSRRPRGRVCSRRSRRPGELAWRPHEVARCGPRAGMAKLIRDGRSHYLSVEMMVYAAFGLDPDGPPPAVELRPIPGFTGHWADEDRGIWHRPANAPCQAMGVPPPLRRLAHSIDRRGVPVVRLAGCAVPVANLISAAWPAPVPAIAAAELGQAAADEPAPVAPPIADDDDDDRPARPLRGSECGRSKLCEATVEEARRLHAAGWTYKAMCARYGIGRVTLHYALVGKTWQHVPMPTDGLPGGDDRG